MGLISNLLNLLFGGNRNVIADTAEVFVENKDKAAERLVEMQGRAIEQLAAELKLPKTGRFDSAVDGLNRLPRPALALGVLALFLSAMIDPLWFAARMQGLALAPEPLWWLLGVIVSFYFGARHQKKAQDFQRDIAATMSRTPQVIENIARLEAMRADSPGAADTGADPELARSATRPDANPALEDWKARRRA